MKTPGVSFVNAPRSVLCRTIRNDAKRSKNTRQLVQPYPARCHQPRSHRLNSILVPVVFGASSSASVDYAIRLASRFSAAIALLHVVKRPYAGTFPGSSISRGLNAKRHFEARQFLATLAKAHEQSRVPIKCLVRNGLPEYEILRLAETLNAGLIVLGRSPRNLLYRLIFGSVVGAVVECSRCPVLVVPAGGFGGNPPPNATQPECSGPDQSRVS